jgi:EPS-associated MarR family transcriptional regulator
MNARNENEAPAPLPDAPDLQTPHLSLLRLLAARPEMSQRELSQSLGLSLGKTHYVLHALLDKGFVKVRNFTRSNHKLGYAYFLTPAGLNEKLRMTREFLARKEQEFEQLKATIAALHAEAWPVTAAPPVEGDGASTQGTARQ